MIRGQLVVVTLLVVLFALAGCKNKGTVEAGKAKPKTVTAAARASAKPAADEAKAAPKEAREEALIEVADQKEAKGVYAAATTPEPETKDHPEDIPTPEDFEDEAILKITPLNLDDEIRKLTESVHDLVDDD